MRQTRIKLGSGWFVSMPIVVVLLAGNIQCNISDIMPPSPTPTSTPTPGSSNCAQGPFQVIAGTQGAAMAFVPDPIISSGIASMSPTSLQLDKYAQSVTLSHLTGKGILEGSYVDVRNGLDCNGASGASDPKNQFIYPHSDGRFQEAMAYYTGDQYRAGLDSLGVLQPVSSVITVAHCMKGDNSYFSNSPVPKVCLGDSIVTQGAFYADDGEVVVHELQHATTVNTYLPNGNLNQLWYDEAGALNEAISDFMAMMFSSSLVSTRFDAKLFSRWALGTFYPNQDYTRGAHRCPKYDPTYPLCSKYPSFSDVTNTVSYVYPDGMGWPYSNTQKFAGPGYLQSIFMNFTTQEEIHNAGVLMEGALGDVFDALTRSHGDAVAAQGLLTKAIMLAVANLPKPDTKNLSPVSYRGFASALVNVATKLSFSAADVLAITQALTDRGLYGGSNLLAAGWEAQGPGTVVTPGMYIHDNPSDLKAWLNLMENDSSIVTQGISTGLNHLLDPGEVAAIWFDIQNNSNLTAGGVLVTVTALDPEIQFVELNTLNSSYAGVLTSSTQIMYGKINGTDIVAALGQIPGSGTPNGLAYPVPTGNTYFYTDPMYLQRRWTTALWVKVLPTAAHGKTVRFQVQAAPSNAAAGVSDSVVFTTVIN